MTNISRSAAWLCVVFTLSIAGPCLAAEAPAAASVVEHVRTPGEPPEDEVEITVYVPSKAETNFFNKLDEKEKTTGGHDDEYDITKKSGKYVAWFGIVREIVEDQARKQTVLTVEHKYFDGVTHQELLYVSFNGSGDFQAIIPGIGHQIGPLSLVRIYGTVSPAKDQQLPRVDAVFVRDWHWDTFTFSEAYGKQRGSEKWRELNHVHLDYIFSPNPASPNGGYYRARLGDRPEDIFRIKAISNRLAQAAKAIEPDPNGNFQKLAEGMLDVNSFNGEYEALSAIFKARAFDGMTGLLNQALQEEDRSLRQRAVHIVEDYAGELAAASIPNLAANINDDKDSFLPETSVRALASIGSPAALPYLIEATKNDDVDTRASALAALPDIGAPVDKILPTLILGLKDPHKSARYSAINGLEKLGPAASMAAEPLIELMKNDKDNSVKSNATHALGGIDADGKFAIPALIEALKSPEASIRRQAALGLGDLGPKAASGLPALKDQLRDSDSLSRIAAAQAIWMIESNLTQTLPLLIKELQSTEPYASYWATTAITEIGPEAQEAIPILLRQRLKDPGGYGKYAARALGKMGKAAVVAIPDLMELLKDKEDAFRVEAAEALWKINQHPAAIPQILKELNESSAGCREATLAVGRIGKPAVAAIPLLKELVYSRSCSTRREARAALKKLESFPGSRMT
jgi:HEAT repeat protein